MQRRTMLMGGLTLLLLIGVSLMVYATSAPSKLDRLQMLALLRAEKFDALEKYLDSRQRAAERGEFPTVTSITSSRPSRIQTWR